MAKILGEDEISELLVDPKGISLADMQLLKTPSLGRSERHHMSAVDVTGESGRKYRLTSRRNRHDDTDFSVILSVFTGPKLLNLIRCNGCHGGHTNRIEKTSVPSDTCHVHRLTERYQRIKVKDPTSFAEVTLEYTGFTGAVDFFVCHFGLYVHKHPYGGPDGLFGQSDEVKT